MSATSKITIVVRNPEFRNYRGEDTSRRTSWKTLRKLRNKTVSNYVKNGGDKLALRYFATKGLVEIADGE